MTFKLRKGQKRGAGFGATAENVFRGRHVWINLTTVDAGPKFARCVLYSLKDFVRGADPTVPGFIVGKPFFSEGSDAVAAAEIKATVADDAAFHRLLINPYDGWRIITRGWVREYMTRLERVLGCRLMWYAAIHSKPTKAQPENRHVHIIIRSQSIGEEVTRFNRWFTLYGFEALASEQACKKLGPMTPSEVERKEQVSQEIMRNQKEKELQQAGVDEWVTEALLRNR